MIDDALEMNAEASMQQEREDRLKQHAFMEEKSKKLEPLFEACEQGNAAELRSLLSIMSQEEKDEALTLNYMSGTTIEILYELGVFNEDLRENSGLKFVGKTLLSLAVESDRLECVKLLLKMNAQVNAKVKSDRTVLHLAILPEGESPSEIRKGIFELLLDKATDINEADGDGLTPIHLAVKENQKEFFNMLAVKDADVNKADLKHRTPLHTAVYASTAVGGNFELDKKAKIYFINALLEKSAKLDEVDPMRLAMVHVYAAGGQAEQLELEIKDKGVEIINIGDADGRTPAYFAATNEENKENSCLTQLINDYNAVYLSRHAARLTEREYLIRAIVFVCLGLVIFGGCYGYLVNERNVSTSCLTAYNDMLLPPYLFIFVSTIVFKVVQYVFEEMMIPALDFLGFVTGITPAIASFFKKVHQSCRPCSVRSSEGKMQNNSASRKVDHETTFRDSIPSVTAETVNPMATPHHGNFGGDVELGPSRTKSDPAHAMNQDGVSEVTFSAPPSATSRLLYRIFGETNVKNWRLKKYRSAYMSSPEYLGVDFSHMPYLFLYLQFIWGYVSFVIAAIRVDRSLSAWEQYTNFFATIVHSGIPTTLLSCLKMAYIDGRFAQMTKNKLLKMLSLIFSLDAFHFVSHSYPGMVLYIWVLILYITAPIGVLGAYEELRTKPYFLTRYFAEFFTELAARFVLIFFVQTLFNYASIFYALHMPISPQDYMSVISQDWALRTQTQCFLNEALKSSRGVVALFSWL